MVRHFLITPAVVVLQMSVDEFVSFQRLTEREQNRRLALPQTCRPVTTATRSGSRQADRVQVEVRCAPLMEIRQTIVQRD
jgi:hypothetical protein